MAPPLVFFWLRISRTGLYGTLVLRPFPGAILPASPISPPLLFFEIYDAPFSAWRFRASAFTAVGFSLPSSRFFTLIHPRAFISHSDLLACPRVVAFTDNCFLKDHIHVCGFCLPFLGCF